MLRFLTSGESHGSCLLTIIEGMVSGLKIDADLICDELRRRQLGYGRGGRMSIENDKAEILSGLRKGETIGSPIALRIENKDFKIDQLPAINSPRPGHADLPGVLKYDRQDARDILERSSARETAARVSVGAISKQFLRSFGVDIISHVISIGDVSSSSTIDDFARIKELAEASLVRCIDENASKRMIARIDELKSEKDTLGGIVEIRVKGVIPGIGSHVHYDRRLDACLANQIMSIQAVKGVEIGSAFTNASLKGSQVHDEIFYDNAAKSFVRKSNRAGGIEGGISNGSEIIMRAAMKPISTLMKPLSSVNIKTKLSDKATIERSDVTAVPACGVVAESVVAFELSKLYLEKFGGDSLKETCRNFEGYKRQVAEA